MDLKLQNKVIVVSGGGESIVKLLADEGAVPVIIGSNEEDNLKTMEAVISAGGNCFQVVAELTKPQVCKNAIEKVMQKFGKIDGLINNVGVNNSVRLEEGSYENFMASLHKNLVHYYLLAHYILPALKISKGSIVNITSKTGNGGHNALTREWAVELLKYGIRVNAVVVAENNIATCGELANTVAFLLSEISSHTTGQLINVHGGNAHPARS